MADIHLVKVGGDKRTLCGTIIETTTSRLLYTFAEDRRARGFPICAACYEAAPAAAAQKAATVEKKAATKAAVDQLHMFDPPTGGGIPAHEALQSTSMAPGTLAVLEQLNRAYTVTTPAGLEAGTSKKYDRARLKYALGALVDVDAALAYLVPLDLVTVTYIDNDGTMDGKARYRITDRGKAEAKRVRSIMGADTE